MVVDQNPNVKEANSGVALDELCTGTLKPALASIPNACKYLGDVSRAKFYSDILPLLETVHLGSRHFVVVASIDRLIAKLKDAPADKPAVRGGRPPIAHAPEHTP
jgi:hypothetical protein